MALQKPIYAKHRKECTSYPTGLREFEFLNVLTDSWKVVEQCHSRTEFVVKAHVILALADIVRFALVDVEYHPPLTHPVVCF
jgi:hypothetical protein